MHLEYHRPQTLEEALALLARETPFTVPLAGGAFLNAQQRPPALPQEDLAVVDLQDLGLAGVTPRGNFIDLGATTPLQSLLEAELPQALQEAAHLETTYTRRFLQTVAGTLVAADGVSPFATAMMALDARLTLAPDDETLPLGELYPARWEHLRGKLITKVTIPSNARFTLETVAPSPLARPLLVVAVAQWPSGRTRIVLGGWGDAPHLAMDGPDATGAEQAARNAAYEATDYRASAEYRREVAVVLVRRALKSLA